MVEQAGQGAEEGLWVRADRQTGGRGRRGRPWVSEPGNVFTSTLVRLRAEDPPAHQLGFIASLALDQAAMCWVDKKRLGLKWPNDLMLDGLKLSGILLERAGEALVVGFGVNLAHHPEDTERPATSFNKAGIEPPSPDVFVETLAEQWRALLTQWRLYGFVPLRDAWLDRSVHQPGSPIIARLSDGVELYGSYDGIDADGPLRLRLSDGSVQLIHAGDIFVL